jgi:beta-galactosidase
MTRVTAAKFSAAKVTGPALHRGTFNITTVGDTFLDLRAWTKGAVWVNGHNLGRFWNIGPQQTLFVPAPFLKPGANDIIVLDLFDAPVSKLVRAQHDPILNETRR